MVEPRYVKSSTTSSVQSPMEMWGTELTSWPRTLVFLILIVRPNSLQAAAKQSISSWSPASVCAVSAASSANSISRKKGEKGSQWWVLKTAQTRERKCSLIPTSLSRILVI